MKEIAKIIWKSPSNIAFVKYWGKKENQLPKNPSLSMTLDDCYTTTSLTILEKALKTDSIDFQFFFEGGENEQFSNRIHNYLTVLLKDIPELNNYNFLIESANSFPHSAGIASSASALSSLALCLTSFVEQFGHRKAQDFYQMASKIARIGSGSAARSVYGLFSTWGKIDGIPGTSDEYASPFETNGSGLFSCMRDSIMIIDSEQKKISSSYGHKQMEDHPYALSRYSDANTNINQLIGVMNSVNFSQFAEIVEHEALSIHAMMMTAKKWYTLLHPNTLLAIDRVRRFREDSNAKVCFTLDAGPNVHVIYPAQEDSLVQPFIESELLELCSEKSYIADKIGLGPELILEEFV